MFEQAKIYITCLEVILDLLLYVYSQDFQGVFSDQVWSSLNLMNPQPFFSFVEMKA